MATFGGKFGFVANCWAFPQRDIADPGAQISGSPCDKQPKEFRTLF